MDDDRHIFTDPSCVPSPSRDISLTVIFDLDETLVDARRDDTVIIRPYAFEILNKMTDMKDVETILWSAGNVRHVSKCLNVLDPKNKYFHHVVARDSEDAVGFQSPKNLKYFKGRPNGKIIIFENTPFCVFENSFQGVILPNFNRNHQFANRDTTLLFVIQIIEFVRKRVVAADCELDKTAAESTNDKLTVELDTYTSLQQIVIMTASEILERWLINPKTKAAFTTSSDDERASTIEEVLSTHPFLVKRIARSSLGDFQYLYLDVVDTQCLGERIKHWRANE